MTYPEQGGQWSAASVEEWLTGYVTGLLAEHERQPEASWAEVKERLTLEWGEVWWEPAGFTALVEELDRREEAGESDWADYLAQHGPPFVADLAGQWAATQPAGEPAASDPLTEEVLRQAAGIDGIDQVDPELVRQYVAMRVAQYQQHLSAAEPKE